MLSLEDRLDRLEAALLAAAPAGQQPSGGPAGRTKADYGPAGDRQKSGRKVASQAGAKRYGLPIGTPLGQTKSKNKGDAATQSSYDTFMSAKTPAELNKAASWMSTDDLKRSGEALFSFDSKNERDQAARMTLVKEFAARGIDPHSVGYKGGPVVLNPSPKADPVAKAAQTAQNKADAAAKKVQTDATKAQQQVAKDQQQAATAQKQQATAAQQGIKVAAQKALLDQRKQLGEAQAEGILTSKQVQQQWRQAHPTKAQLRRRPTATAS